MVDPKSQQLSQRLAQALAEQSSLAQEIRRTRVLASLVQQGYRLAGQCENNTRLTQKLLHLLLKAAMVDMVALYELHRGEARLLHSLGHWQDPISHLSQPNESQCWQKGQPLPPELAPLINANECHRLLYHQRPDYGLALVLGLNQGVGVSLKLSRDDFDFLDSVLTLLQDLLERFTLNNRLKAQATQDPLTKLPNRILAFDRLQQAIDTFNPRNNQLVLVFFLDLDRFKDVNDIYGHHSGDQLLRMVGQRLGNSLRTGDTLARLGSDQFLVILDHASKLKTADVIATNLLDCFKTPFNLLKGPVKINASIGIAVYPGDGDSATVLVRNADAARLQAREDGDNRYRFFTPAMNKAISARVNLERALQQALAKQELSLVYQPQVEISTGRVLGVEALLRWHSAELGSVSPEQFIPLAEEDGLINPIGLWVLEEACRQQADWLEQGLRLRMAINVSARQLREPSLVDNIEMLLQRYRLPASGLELELTERVVLDAGHEQTRQNLQGLQALGLSLALDDFGTGYSSLRYLNEHAFHCLKIDKAFVSQLQHGGKEKTLISAVIAMAQKLGIWVVAEGVETEEQLTQLKLMNCNAIQGYLFAPPLPPRALLEALTVRDGHCYLN
ncbi:EAL domain-containing protein [Gallaecimonas sp. GXIMD4217]|uniref:putative bifunctional diguanylate cyclase/phosphodiesterase n=1 Tax=Gallaecimonas sp. GXIMD4217 TaxID=3131927 RepID=UPI00311AD1E2